MLGSGTARPVGLAGAELHISPPANFGSVDWGGQKVLWALDVRDATFALVRGRRLDGGDEIRFDDAAIPATEKLMMSAPGSVLLAGGWLGFPGYTRVRGPGCYAFQIDTPNDTSIVVFTAVEL